MLMLMLRLVSNPYRLLPWRSRFHANIQCECLRRIHRNASLSSQKRPTRASATEAPGKNTPAGQGTEASDPVTKARPKKTITRKKPRASKITDLEATVSHRNQDDPELVEVVTKVARKSRSKVAVPGSSRKSPKRAKNPTPEPEPENNSAAPTDPTANSTVTGTLRERYGTGRRRNPLGDTKRVHIVGEGLCGKLTQ